MANNNTSQVQIKKNKSIFDLLFTPVGWALSILIYVIISIIVGTIIEWVGITFYWDTNHAEKILYQEFQYLGDNFATTLFGLSAKDTALLIINWLNSHMLTASNHASEGTIIIERFLGEFSDLMRPYINAAIYITMITAVRCLIILLSVALFIIAGIAAMVDGLYQREMRKVSGGVEHGGVFHHAKAWVGRVATMSPVLYLAWPSDINPNLILLPGICLFYVAVLISFSTFKKYI